MNGAVQEVVLLGYFEHARPDAWKPERIIRRRMAVALTAEDEVVYLNADLVRFIDSVVGGFDALKVRICAAGPTARNPLRRAAYDPAVFFRRGVPVAVLMPLAFNREDIPIDVDRARERLGMPAPRPASDADRRRAMSPPEALVDTWIGFGEEVPWMHLASLPFGRERFTVCRDAEDFIASLLRFDRHQLGAAYVLGDVCVINLNSRPGSSEEWLAIKGRTVIGNVPLRVRTELGDLDHEATAAKLREALDMLRRAREEQYAEPDFTDLQ